MDSTSNSEEKDSCRIDTDAAFCLHATACKPWAGPSLRTFLSLLLLFTLSIESDAGETPDSLWVRGIEGRTSMEGKTPDEARGIALRRARERAVKAAFGTTISSSFQMKQSELVEGKRVVEANESTVKVISELARGQVLRDSVLSAHTPEMDSTGQMPRPDYVVRIDAFVVRERGDPDPDFELTIGPLRDSYKAEEELELEVMATKDCYVNVFAIGVDDLVYHLFPNPLERGNHLRADIRRAIPGSGDYSFKVQLQNRPGEGKATSSETILAVGTKDSTSFRLGVPFKGGVGYAEMRLATREQLMRWLVQLPLDRRALAEESYIIRK